MGNVVIQYKTLEVSRQGIFNVRCYGAKGDGQTDDLAAILSARDTVNAEGGGVLLFPRGTFVVSNTIELGASTTVLGLGASSVLQAKPGVGCFNMLRVRNRRRTRPGSRARRKPRQHESAGRPGQ